MPSTRAPATCPCPHTRSPEPRTLNPAARAPKAQLLATSHRWRLTFFFGLIHGFGFANVLRELGLPATGLIQCLLAFNAGVEAGQLAIAVFLLPLALLLQHWRQGSKLIAAAGRIRRCLACRPGL